MIQFIAAFLFLSTFLFGFMDTLNLDAIKVNTKKTARIKNFVR
ncbi:hypothetical protein BMS3Abin04_01802 [bacterium BMS3Abin04]|nr:hypothetical protein BMS3Abin04_01802 [bacterium BMS3Abin04]